LKREPPEIIVREVQPITYIHPDVGATRATYENGKLISFMSMRNDGETIQVERDEEGGWVETRLPDREPTT